VSELPAGVMWPTGIFLLWALFVPGPVSLAVRPSFAIAPGSFQATIIIERHHSNRQLEWGFVGPEERHTTISLDGAQRTRVFYPKPWEQLSGGDYIAYASLTRIVHGREQVIRVEQSFRSIHPEDF
jgi:hypothetical protein